MAESKSTDHAADPTPEALTIACVAKAAVERTHVLTIGDLVRALEGAAMNTDTDPRWLAASELRRLEQDRKINIRSGEQP